MYEILRSEACLSIAIQINSIARLFSLLKAQVQHDAFEEAFDNLSAGLCGYLMFICVRLLLCLTCLISSLSVDMLHCSLVPVISTDHSLKCGECTYLVQSCTYTTALLETVTRPVSCRTEIGEPSKCQLNTKLVPQRTAL